MNGKFLHGATTQVTLRGSDILRILKEAGYEIPASAHVAFSGDYSDQRESWKGSCTITWTENKT